MKKRFPILSVISSFKSSIKIFYGCKDEREREREREVIIISTHTRTLTHYCTTQLCLLSRFSWLGQEV